MNFSKFLGTTFFLEHIRATAFGLSFVNPRKKSERTSLAKLGQSFRFNIKQRKDLLKREDQKQPPEVFY